MISNIKITGHYEIPSKGLKFTNDITRLGLNRLGTGGTLFTTCVLGTGLATDAFEVPSLDALHATTTTVVSALAYQESILLNEKITKIKFSFAANAITQTVSEIGVGWSATTLFSKALIRDIYNQPTAITVDPGEVLEVLYYVTTSFVTEDQVEVINIDGVDYTFTLRPALIQESAKWGCAVPNYTQANSIFYNGPIRTMLEGPTGTYAVASSGITASAYVTDNFNRDFSVSMLFSEFTNATGITSFIINSNVATMGIYQVGVSPAIQLVSPNRFKFTFRIQWG